MTEQFCSVFSIIKENNKLWKSTSKIFYDQETFMIDMGKCIKCIDDSCKKIEDAKSKELVNFVEMFKSKGFMELNICDLIINPKTDDDDEWIEKNSELEKKWNELVEYVKCVEAIENLKNDDDDDYDKINIVNGNDEIVAQWNAYQNYLDNVKK